MDPESKKLLEETLELEKENNHMLHKIRNVQKWATFWSLFKVFLIIGITLGSFYFLEPYIDNVLNLYGSLSGTTQKLDNAGSSIQDFLKNL
jgi:hypothetical protein